jgi:RNA polymerase sigma-70 factor (ECF subfamily)
VEGRPLDEVDLTRRAKEGDMDAYAALVSSYQPIAVRLAHLICGASGDAEDAAQQAFVKAHRALGRHREGAPLRPWVLRIVANEAKNQRRSAGRRARYELAVVEDRASGEAAPSPEDADLDVDDRRRLLAHVVALPARLRDVVACRYLLGLSEAETADVLGLPRGTVKSRLSRGLDRLRVAIEAEEAVDA